MKFRRIVKNQLLKNYDQLGIPFIAAIGREIYQFEKNIN